MRGRWLLFVTATLAGGVLGVLWNAPVFKSAYEGFIRLFVDPAAPLAGVGTALLLAFAMGVARICVP